MGDNSVERLQSWSRSRPFKPARAKMSRLRNTGEAGTLSEIL